MAGGAISLGIAFAEGQPDDFHRAPVAALALGSFAFGLVVLLAGFRFSANTVFGLTVFGTLLIGTGTYWLGVSLGPFGAMLFIWSGTYGYYFFTRARAAFLTALIGITYAAVLALQPSTGLQCAYRPDGDERLTLRRD
ncbi:MAG TPA: hypothetical protein VM030_01305 [Acidimicrobiales bacterium]|nr:hypothetical protein [Acidimicrobiales bacterium]